MTCVDYDIHIAVLFVKVLCQVNAVESTAEINIDKDDVYSVVIGKIHHICHFYEAFVYAVGVYFFQFTYQCIDCQLFIIECNCYHFTASCLLVS